MHARLLEQAGGQQGRLGEDVTEIVRHISAPGKGAGPTGQGSPRTRSPRHRPRRSAVLSGAMGHKGCGAMKGEGVMKGQSVLERGLAAAGLRPSPRPGHPSRRFYPAFTTSSAGTGGVPYKKYSAGKGEPNQMIPLSTSSSRQTIGFQSGSKIK